MTRLRVLNGVEYRVIVEPTDIAHPDGPRMQVYYRGGDGILLALLETPKAASNDDEIEALFAEGWRIANEHAKPPAPSEPRA